jgi:ESS family glutamate:Na+ symporter
MGVPAAAAVAMASATFGITVAGLSGAYLGARLIRKHKLTAPSGIPAAQPRAGQSNPADWLRTVPLIGISIGLGNLLSGAIERRGVILPAYIGAMIVAAVIRNLDDRLHFARVSQADVDALGRIALYLFIVMALITLRLWELAALALPLVAILAAQVALCWAMCVTLCYWTMGRDYEAAVTSAGFCGFMLGITANAVACMEELVETYGPAPRSFLIVPVVGAFLIDFSNSLIITAMANFTR